MTGHSRDWGHSGPRGRVLGGSRMQWTWAGANIGAQVSPNPWVHPLPQTMAEMGWCHPRQGDATKPHSFPWGVTRQVWGHHGRKSSMFLGPKALQHRSTRHWPAVILPAGPNFCLRAGFAPGISILPQVAPSWWGRRPPPPAPRSAGPGARTAGPVITSALASAANDRTAGRSHRIS